MATNITREDAPVGSLPGAGLADQLLDALQGAADDLAGIPAADPFPEIKPAVMLAYNRAIAVRTRLWTANDALIKDMGASRAIVEMNQRSASESVAPSGWGSVAERQSAQGTAAGKAFTDAKAAIAKSVVIKLGPAADQAAADLATALADAAAVLTFAGQRVWGVPSTRPDFNAADVARVNALADEIKIEGLAWAVDYLRSAIAAKQSDHDLFVACAAILRCCKAVRGETQIATAARVGPSQGNAAASAERESADVAYAMIDAFYTSKRPASLIIGSRSLTTIEAVSYEMCGEGGNLGRLSAGQFANEFLNPERAKDVTKFQVRSGFMASWLPVGTGRCPPGYSPLSGSTTSTGIGFRMPATVGC